MAVYGMGPHSGGVSIAYTTWIKTNKCKPMVIASYADVFAHKWPSKRHQFTLALINGRPVVFFSAQLRLSVLRTPRICKTKKWTHVAITMPRNSSLASEVEIFIDAKKVDTIISSQIEDGHVFMTTRGRFTVGGWGYSGAAYDRGLLRNFIGQMDELRVYSRPLESSEIFTTMGQRVFKKYPYFLCRRHKKSPVILRSQLSTDECKNHCLNQPKCKGFEVNKRSSDGYWCVLFSGAPKPRKSNKNDAICYIMRT